MPEHVPPHERATVTIREDIKGRILLTGLHQVNIDSIEDLLEALNFGSSIRQTDATAINAKSSRSHAVFSLNLVQRRNKGQSALPQEKRFSVPLEVMTGGAESWMTVDSKLHFVDLAGSERLKNTGASGDRVKEGISINGGLTSLGKVISQLSSRHPGSHVSYRDSKLTRLLQDSLGGNAVTYMVACVTPAEFHLSETLNTVQYAQRARHIQSKPRIQQISDDTDKHAIIDRLRAEVSFLRDQIRSTERESRPSGAPQERIDRQNDREIELQNHLLDVQENYAALNQRHKKLMSEITKAQDNDFSDTPTLTGVMGDSAVERLKRSNSFAEAVEKMVEEYQTTIESLETSLSKTRSSLSTTESSLLERETKCAYIETVNQQLHNRLQKMMDRELSTETYLRELESRVDGQSAGEEKSSAVVVELRREIARIRENEAGCEEYISTLEERLAETDQDLELMQREVDRLEHVVERQRSIGKLDTLLYEFDHIRQSESNQEDNLPEPPPIDGFTEPSVSTRSKEESSDSILQAAMGTAIPESDDEEGADSLTPNSSASDPSAKVHEADEDQKNVPSQSPEASQLREKSVSVPQSSQTRVQSKFVADKLESVTRELFDLQIEHEATVNEYDLMAAKYEEALRTLAELQDAADEARHPVSTPTSTPPASFLGDARVNELKGGGQSSSSRSLSSELSLVGDSTTHHLEEPAMETPQWRSFDVHSATAAREQSLQQEIQELKRIQGEKDLGMATLNNQYLQLQALHLETLDLIEELKTEVHKAKLYNSTPTTSPVIRRKASQSVMTIDRAHRSLASLRNIAAENLEDKPDTMRSFELNINTAMHELHQRSERVEALEAELAGVKKEMEGKMTMISGLARERSSLKGSSPMDISVVSSMHNQLLEAENQMKVMHESHVAREHELLHEVESLQNILNRQAQGSKSIMPGVFPETPAASVNESDEKQLGETGAHSQEISRLHEELRQWQQKHSAAVESMRGAEANFRSTIAEMETSLASKEFKQIEEASSRHAIQDDRISTLLRDLEKEKIDHADAIGGLHEQINVHKMTVDAHLNKISELEQLYVAARQEIENGALHIQNTQSQLDSHRDQILMLERQLEDHKSAVEFHKHGLRSLHDSHAQDLEETRSATLAEAKSGMEAQLQDLEAELNEQHRRKDEALMRVIESANHQLKELVSVRNNKSFEIEGHSPEEQIRLLSRLVAEVKEICQHDHEGTQGMKQKITSLDASILELKNSQQQSVTELQRVNEEKEKARRLVDELEDQLYTTYNQHQATSSRLSILNSSRDQALQDANAVNARLEEELDSQRARVAHLEVNIFFSLFFDLLPAFICREH